MRLALGELKTIRAEPWDHDIAAPRFQLFLAEIRANHIFTGVHDELALDVRRIEKLGVRTLDHAGRAVHVKKELERIAVRLAFDELDLFPWQARLGAVLLEAGVFIPFSTGIVAHVSERIAPRGIQVLGGGLRKSAGRAGLVEGEGVQIPRFRSRRAELGKRNLDQDPMMRSLVLISRLFC